MSQHNDWHTPTQSDRYIPAPLIQWTNLLDKSNVWAPQWLLTADIHIETDAENQEGCGAMSSNIGLYQKDEENVGT